MLTDLIIARSVLNLDKPNVDEYAIFSCRVSDAFRALAAKFRIIRP